MTTPLQGEAPVHAGERKPPSLFDWNIVGPAIGDAFRKLDPRAMAKNPVMFVTELGARMGFGRPPADDN